MNQLQFYKVDDPKGRQGFRDILVTEDAHPFVGNWWPPGHLVGYEQTFVHTFAEFVRAVVRGKSEAPTFADGLATQQALAAITESTRAKSGSRSTVPPNDVCGPDQSPNAAGNSA